MKLRKSNMVLMAVALVILAAPAAWSAEAAKPILFKLSQPTPPTGFYGEGYAYFAKVAEEETKGRSRSRFIPPLRWFPIPRPSMPSRRATWISPISW